MIEGVCLSGSYPFALTKKRRLRGEGNSRINASQIDFRAHGSSARVGSPARLPIAFVLPSQSRSASSAHGATVQW